MSQHRPALRFVIPFILGILLGAWINLPTAILFILTILMILLSLVLSVLKKWRYVTDASMICSIILLGALLQTIEQQYFYEMKLEPVYTNEQIKILGTIDTEPIEKEKKITFSVQTDKVVRLKKIETKSHRVMVLLYLNKGENKRRGLEYGKRIEITGTIESYPFQRNPGEFDYGKYLELNNIQGIISVRGMHNIQVVGEGDNNSLQSWTYSVQKALYSIIDSLHTPRHASFLKGIIFGYRSDIPSDIKQSFMDTGTIHILAVSGSNVAFVALMLFAVFGFFRLSHRAVVVITILGSIVYMLITGSSPSVVRATIMAIVILCGTLFERKADIYNSISVAAFILLIWNTNTLFDIGFQLSFAAVLSIVFFYPKLEILIKKVPERFEEIKAVDAILKLFAVSLAAQLGTLPFTAYYFGRVSIISLLANIPVVPISGLNTFIGFAEVLFSFINSWVAGLYASANDFLVWFLLGFVKQAASVPFAYLEIWNLSTTTIIAYYVIVIGIFYLNSPRVRAYLVIFILVLGNYIIFEQIWTFTHPKLIITVIDVGQGDAILLESPNGKTMLVDAGPSSNKFDSGKQKIVPLLKRKRISNLDYVLITHPHNDHFGGVNSLIKSIRVDTLLIGSNISNNHQVVSILKNAEERQIGVRIAREGEQGQIDPITRLYILYPDYSHANEKNANNSSIVLKILFGKSSILLVGDAETVVEQRIVSRYKKFLSSNIIKVGHHGSITSTSAEFLKEVNPTKAIISVGAHNKFRHPSPLVLERLKACSVEVQRTDRSGAIVMESNGEEWKRKDWRD